MGPATITFETACDPAVVFGFVADPTTEPRWNPNAVRAELVNDGPIQPGSKVRSFGSMGGRETAVDITVETLEPPRRTTTVATSGALTFRTAYDIAPTALGSRVTMTVDIEASGLLRALVPLIRLGFARRLRGLRATLKSAVDDLPLP